MLAFYGGSPIISDVQKEHKQYPLIGDIERSHIEDVLKSGKLWGTWAPKTKELENVWRNYIGTKYCLAVCSGTSALHCALFGCGILPGEEVIVPAYSFIATATSVLMINAIPIFVDVDENGNIDSDKIENYINSRTRAIIVVHLHGMAANIHKIKEITSKYKLKLIEDCSQAHGATHNGIKVGGIGDVGTFSLNATKVLAGGEGGLITTNDEYIYNRIAKMRVFGMEVSQGKYFYRDADGLGYNYRINEFCAAFTLGRFTQFEYETEQRIKNAEFFIFGVKDLKGISFSIGPKEGRHIYQLLRIRVNPLKIGLNMDKQLFRHRLLIALEKEGLQFWIWEDKPLPAYGIFKTKNIDEGGLPWNLPNAREGIDYDLNQYPISLQISGDSIFTVAHYPPNDTKLMSLYIDAFHKVWRHIEDVARINECPSRSNHITPF
jgi:dTDP-4-amino-4,6-dideoxygalactose transaminase